MEPRAYSPAPIGTQFVLLGYAHQSGDVLLDSSLPLKDVAVKFNFGSIGYGRTFGLAGHQASVAVLAPYIWARHKDQSSNSRSWLDAQAEVISEFGSPLS